ncbi:hypothetical protein NPA08_00760 [Mycoplasmopsis citelli]|uniref:Uncharacterized protein n=1 Tax=Mycoplasmopsis citelli TaxID=171281 RepID=A0A449B3C0_9BACT|nr:hypothetical protein [Mycoplasmopsis citelli]UUD36355.1 hypothetical protein NPA08_00760 [Mycoplasmopsis citelli]VEU75061.1 Uncharacterised protein [Mycoplasmopsis citelli]
MTKKSKKKLLLLGLIPLIGTIFGIGYGTAKTINQYQISALNNQINELNLKFEKYNLANKQDKLKIQSLQSQSKNLQFLVQNLQESDLSSENFNDFISKFNYQKISEDAYKTFEKPLLNWKSNLVKKVSSLNKTLKNLLENNNLTQETRQGVTESLNKAKSLLNSLNEITFNDTKSAVKAFKSIQKSQNIFLNKLNSSINLIVRQINKHNQEVNDLKEQIGQRDQKIKDLAEKLISQLRFYLELIAQFKNNLQDFNGFDFGETDSDQPEKIKNKIQETLKIITKKESLFIGLVDQMNESLTEAEEKNDYSDFQVFNLNIVQKSFEKIVKEYDLIRNAIIPSYTKWNQEKGLQIINQSKRIAHLESQNQTLQANINSLEQNLEQTKNDLMSSLALLLENQITNLGGIEETIRSTGDTNATDPADKLKHQIQTLTNLKTQYTADNYSQTFTPVFNDALRVAQEVIQEYKSNVLDALKVQYQGTLDSLNSTKEQLSTTQSELNAKNQELTNTQNSLNAVQAELEQNKLSLDTTQETLRITQSQLQELNAQITTNKAQAKVVFNTVKSVYDDLKVKANTLIGEMESSIDVSELRSKLNEDIVPFEENISLEQMQANIKSSLDKITQLNNLFNDTYQKDFAFKNQKSQQQIQSLESQKDLIEKSIEDLQAKQANFSNILSRNVSALTSAYITRKNAAQKTKESAKQYQINTSELEKFLALQDLQAPGNDLTKQIDFVEKYNTRIINLSSETLKLQGQILKKSEKQNQKSIEELKRLTEQNDQLTKEQVDLNKKLHNANASSKEANDRNEQLQKYADNQRNYDQQQIAKLQEQKQSVQKQLDVANTKIKEATDNYIKYKNVILNSNLYQNATNRFAYSINGWSDKLITGYSDPQHDKENYNKYFEYQNPGFKLDRISVISKFRVKIMDPNAEKYTFRIYYIDTEEKDDTKKLKYIDWIYERKVFLENQKIAYSSKVKQYNINDSAREALHTELLLVKLVNADQSQLEFINVAGDYLKIKTQDAYLRQQVNIEKLFSRAPIVGIEEIIKKEFSFD